MIIGSSEKDVVSEMVKRYRILPEQVLEDFSAFTGRLESLLLTPDLDPESFLDMDRIELHQDQLSAPLRLDCALTYQVPEEGSTLFAPVDRVKRSLDTEEWKMILQKAWDKGIPHVVFTGGEPTLRPDIPELITFCEQLGQVTGLITDGQRLMEKGFLHALLQAGLDHIMLILDPSESGSWEAIKDVINEDIALTVHLTINDHTLKNSDSILGKLKTQGVTKISISSCTPGLENDLSAITRKAHDLGLSLVWDLPVPYSQSNPISMELQNSQNMNKGAGRSWLYVEPDGDVLPGQGINVVLGNMLMDHWETIWSASKKWMNESK
jgi:MoaA/NifB/PqqE/SkfB family radical SAM enzyme